MESNSEKPRYCPSLVGLVAGPQEHLSRAIKLNSRFPGRRRWQ